MNRRTSVMPTPTGGLTPGSGGLTPGSGGLPPGLSLGTLVLLSLDVPGKLGAEVGPVATTCPAGRLSSQTSSTTRIPRTRAPPPTVTSSNFCPEAAPVFFDRPLEAPAVVDVTGCFL